MSKPAQPKQSIKKEIPTQRLYKGKGQVDHDLYKLQVAVMRTNTSFNKKPKWEEAEHCHFFHSVDSDGRPQKMSAPVGGHTHKMILVKAASGSEPAVYHAGPAVKEVRRQNAEGNWVKDYEPVKHDDHSHEVVYLNSITIPKRVYTPAAVAIQAEEANKTAPVPGITDGIL